MTDIHGKLPKSLIASIRAGSRVTILVPAGRNIDGSYDWRERTGRAVIKGPHGWVLNMGGKHGTPAVADERNITGVR